jgi:hypothetical protein
MIHTTNLGDIATIRSAPRSIEQGKVNMLSIRGINVITAQGSKFVKWCNVVEIHKEASRKE